MRHAWAFYHTNYAVITQSLVIEDPISHGVDRVAPSFGCGNYNVPEIIFRITIVNISYVYKICLQKREKLKIVLDFYFLAETQEIYVNLL